MSEVNNDLSMEAFKRVQEARHPERPYTLDILATVFTDFIELHGDRRYADDPAMISGFAKVGRNRGCRRRAAERS